MNFCWTIKEKKKEEEKGLGMWLIGSACKRPWVPFPAPQIKTKKEKQFCK